MRFRSQTYHQKCALAILALKTAPRGNVIKQIQMERVSDRVNHTVSKAGIARGMLTFFNEYFIDSCVRTIVMTTISTIRKFCVTIMLKS